MKKRLSLIIAATLAGSMVLSVPVSAEEVDTDALTAAATEIGSTYEGEDVDLSFWYLQTRQEGTDELIAIWNEANPNIQITASYYDTDGIKDACKTAAQSGSLPSFWFNWGGALGQYYVDNGCTYDLTQYAEDNNWADEINAGAGKGPEYYR